MTYRSGISHQKAELLKDVIFAADDGIITTFAIAAGVQGGALPPSAFLILGLANLFADGFSMAVSNYLGTKSEKEFLEAQKEKSARYETPLRNALVTFFSFVIAGSIPILSFIPTFSSSQSFFYTIVLSLTALFLVGALRAAFTRRKWFGSGLEMLLLGGLAAGIAYLVGFSLRGLIG